jgi:hypothetical protein
VVTSQIKTIPLKFSGFFPAAGLQVVADVTQKLIENIINIKKYFIIFFINTPHFGFLKVCR